MGTHFLRHFAYNHASQHKTGTFKYSRVAHAKPIQLPKSMRFQAGKLVGPPKPPESPNPYTFASESGNGNKDLMTPFYGSYSHHYGPVYQLLTPVSGYGGYPATVDPRGFNAPTQNFTSGVFANDFKTPPTQPNILGQNYGLSGGLSGRFGGGVLAVNSMPRSGPILPGPGLPLGHPALHLGGPHTIVGQISGTIPVMYPSGASRGLTSGIAMRAANMAFAPGVHPASLPIAAGVPGIAAPILGAAGIVPGHTIMPMNPVQAAPSGFIMRSPYNPAYSTGMMQHRQLTLNGAANAFGTPGFFHPMSDHYPTPDMDRYSTVAQHPVLPPNYGKENAPAGSGAAPAAGF